MTFPITKAGQTDVAALAAAAVASAIGTLGAAGPYDLSGFLLGISITAILFSYLRLNQRDQWQSLAVASVSAVVLIPVACFPYEAWQADHHGIYIYCPTREICSPASRVNVWLPLAIWLLVAAVVYAWDRRHQRELALSVAIGVESENANRPTEI